ncbi:MAG: hypothetical protein AAFX78_02665 [Cyanobacteria bacterium J06638_20]
MTRRYIVLVVTRAHTVETTYTCATLEDAQTAMMKSMDPDCVTAAVIDVEQGETVAQYMGKATT